MKLDDLNAIRLWVDDIRPTPPEYNVTVNNAVDAIKHLNTGNVVEISLDHDLGDDNIGTQIMIAKFIEMKAYDGSLPRLIWHIHSDNAAGRRYMEMALKNADKYWDKADEQA